jgi:hypothetical protein
MSSVATFETRLCQRFYELARQVTLYAREGERYRIMCVIESVETGAMSMRDGHAVLARLHRQQQVAA